jgi:hypothetical protein
LDAEGETDADADADGLLDGEILADGLKLADGLLDGLKLADGEMEADGETEADSETVPAPPAVDARLQIIPEYWSELVYVISFVPLGPATACVRSYKLCPLASILSDMTNDDQDPPQL